MNNTKLTGIEAYPARLHWCGRIGLAGACGGAAALAFLLPQAAWLCWIAFVPLLWALQGLSGLRSYAIGVIAGMVFYAVGAYWLVHFFVLLKGYSAVPAALLAIFYWSFCAQLFGVLAWGYCWLHNRTALPVAWLFSVLLAAAFAFLPNPLSTQLGESQASFTIAAQGVDMTGVSGIDFMIGMVNALLFGALASSRTPGGSQASALACVCVCVWFGYGVVSSRAWTERVASQPTINIGIVQPNETPSASLPPPQPGFTRSWPPEMQISEQLASRGARIIIWPEGRYRGYLNTAHVQRAYGEAVAQFGVPVLLQDMEIGTDRREYNASVIIDATGRQRGKYRKRARLAFAEYIPVFGDVQWVRSAVRGYLGAFFSDTAQGSRAETFAANELRLVPLICYEIMFSRLASQSTPPDVAGLMLVAQSNDGWFGASRQPFMHLQASRLRAIENRLPVVHAINNGPSAVVGADGRVVAQAPAFAAGGLLAPAPYRDSGGKTFYARHAGWFEAVLLVLVAAAFAVAVRGLRQPP